MKKDDTRHTAAEKYAEMVSPSKGVHTEGKGNSTKGNQKSLGNMHASDYQDRDKANNEYQSNPTPAVKELSTAVKKKPIGSSAPVNEQAAEDLYTAVMKKPKEIEENDAIIVPPTPPLTIEELYTAVNKS